MTPAGLDSPATIIRKSRKLERDLGPLVLRRDVADPEVFSRLINWKSEQYRRTSTVRLFEVAQHRGFYEELRRRGIFRATTLHAGDRLVAGKISWQAGLRHLARLTVYDPALAGYSVGSILELEALRASFEAGDEEFDFLTGGEPYKYTWATHVRWLGPLGKEPAGQRLQRQVRATVGHTLSRSGAYPLLQELGRKAQRRLTRR